MVGEDDVAAAVAAVRAGRPVLLPADGVYGLCASAFREAPVRRLYELKGRGEAQPTAMIASSVDMLLECVPELRGRGAALVRALLPGPYTLVLPNPARRYPWLNGTSPETIGVRVADLPTPSQHVLDYVGAVAATSANDPGERAAASLADVSRRIREGCGAELDAGELSGEPSTVLDLTGKEPAVLREGAGAVTDALARVRAALR
jgi:tRNA threonylcarbamoyl adenosine modification protein (Sua5/YciO/YrdC/YwlC family)